MDYRKHKEYKKLNPYLAVGYAEGFEPCTKIKALCAWQYIVDKKLYMGLQGWFGRTAEALIEQGVISR